MVRGSRSPSRERGRRERSRERRSRDRMDRSRDRRSRDRRERSRSGGRRDRSRSGGRGSPPRDRSRDRGGGGDGGYGRGGAQDMQDPPIAPDEIPDGVNQYSVVESGKRKSTGDQQWQAEIVLMRPSQGRDLWRRPGQRIGTVVVRGPTRISRDVAEDDGRELERVAKSHGDVAAIWKAVRAAASRMADGGKS